MHYFLVIRLSERNHSYYPTFRKQYRYPYQKKLLKEELPTMKALEEEERPTYFRRIRKEILCWGYQFFIGLIPFMDMIFSGTPSLMLYVSIRFLVPVFLGPIVPSLFHQQTETHVGEPTYLLYQARLILRYLVIKGQLRRRLLHSFSPRCIIVL